MSLTQPVVVAPRPMSVATPRPVATSSCPLPLPRPDWGAPQALAAYARARRLDPSLPRRASVVSALTTVVLRAGDLAVKVYPPGTDPGHLDRLGRALAGSGTAHPTLAAPVVTAYGVVSVSAWLPASRPVSWPELGTLLRAFHAEQAGADVAPWTPLSRLPSQVAGLPEEAAQVLLAARAVLLEELAGLRSELGPGTIHGDVSPSNVMCTEAGPRLIDLDWMARAPREYDLASAARRVRAGEMSPRTYRAFCTAYGHDVRGWPGLPVLDRIADLGGVAFRLWDDRHHGRSLGWVPDELKVWRTPL